MLWTVVANCKKICSSVIRMSNAHRTMSSMYVNMSSNKKSKEHTCTDIVWMDLEMTGLDIRNDKILEVSCLITDGDLNLKSEGPCVAIKQPKEVLENMDEWCIKTHNESGLVKKCLESDITQECAETMILEYLSANLPKGKCPLAGNTIYMDRLFISEHMPSVNAYLHYRIIDVSSIKELARRWNACIHDGAPKKKFSHRSLDDIMESIEELKYYREHFFKGVE